MKEQATVNIECKMTTWTAIECKKSFKHAITLRPCTNVIPMLGNSCVQYYQNRGGRAPDIGPNVIPLPQQPFNIVQPCTDSLKQLVGAGSHRKVEIARSGLIWNLDFRNRYFVFLKFGRRVGRCQATSKSSNSW